MVRPNHFQDWGETRRLKALELSDAGWSQLEIAAALEVTPGAVSQWLRRAHLEGRDALRHRRDPGRASRLTQDQIDRLLTLLTGSPRAAGLQCETLHSESWTRGLVKDLVLQVLLSDGLALGSNDPFAVDYNDLRSPEPLVAFTAQIAVHFVR